MFNGGVMLVSPNDEVFDILRSDFQRQSEWHVPTSYREFHFLQWVSDSVALDQTLNLCLRMGKGQANSRWWHLVLSSTVNIYNFSTKSKP